MRTIGVDLSTDPRKTAICSIDWDSAEAVVIDLLLPANVATIQGQLSGLGPDDWAAVDAPFGWPAKFVSWIAEYSGTGIPPMVDTPDWRLRRTDRLVSDELGKNPLSVSSDRIASTARLAAEILAGVTRGGKVDRTGTRTRIVECYPAATLAAFGVPSDGYKDKTDAAGGRRAKILDRIVAESREHLTVSQEHRGLLRSSDDLLDSLICAISARVAALGRDRQPAVGTEEEELAKSEGWIRFPRKGTTIAELFETES